MSINNAKYVYCDSAQHTNRLPVLSVSPYSEDGMLRLSFFRGDFFCSIAINKDEAREFAENILELLEEISEPNPNQESLDLPQQEAA